MSTITKSPPWETFYNEVAAIFGSDKDIKVLKLYSDKEKKIKILVDNHTKYELLNKYLVREKTFGTVTVLIDVVDSNAPAVMTSSEDMVALFAGNKAVSTISSQAIPGGNVTYVAFNNGVVQFLDDNLADLHRNKTMLMEQIARDVFNMPIDGVYFCTDIPKNTLNKTAPTKPMSTKNADVNTRVAKMLDELFS